MVELLLRVSSCGCEGCVKEPGPGVKIT